MSACERPYRVVCMAMAQMSVQAVNEITMPISQNSSRRYVEKPRINVATTATMAAPITSLIAGKSSAMA